MINGKKIGLVLSGGGAMGFAHIGVLQVLSQNHVPIDIVTGTSMGALIGGLYASGMNYEEMKKRVGEFKSTTLMDFDPFLLFKSGIMGGKKLTKYLRTLYGDIKIEDCPTTFGCVATDLLTGDMVELTSGDLCDAVRASIAIPGVFTGVKKDGMELYDGGMTDNLPINLARKLGADVVIAIYVSPYKKEADLRRSLSVLVSGFNRATDSVVRALNEHADVFIQVDQPDVYVMSFSKPKINKSLKYGIKAAEDAMPELLKTLKKKGVAPYITPKKK